MEHMVSVDVTTMSQLVQNPGEHRRTPMDDNRWSVGQFRIAADTHVVIAADLKSVQCRFESDWGHRIRARQAS
jgi:hypothetical protein